MVGPEVARLIEGWGDELDVWELFRRDAHGGTGLYQGQLVQELAEARPGLVPRIVDALRRGLQSQDPAEREAALHGAKALNVEADLRAQLAGLFTLAPALTTTPLFIDVVAKQPAAAGLIDQVLAQGPGRDADQALAWLLARHRPAALRAGILAALASGVNETRAEAFVRAAGPEAGDALAEELAQDPAEDRRERAAELFYRALEADQQPGGYDRWLTLRGKLGLALEGVPPRPFESDEDRARRERFAAMRARLLAAEQAAAAPVTAAQRPNTVVLSAAVWVDALRLAEGPPVELLELLRRHGVTVLRSDALLAVIDDTLQRLGWDDARRATARARVVEVTTDPRPGAHDDEATLARASGLDAVYSVGPGTGQTGAGVTFKPVHELITILSQT